MASAGQTGSRAQRRTVTDHEGFLRHARFRWLKLALAVSLISLVGYVAADGKVRPYGGSWYGYTLGTIGALLIVWLALLGIRKRAMTRGRWSLKAWTSAHVYLGLALIVIATLHTGFQFGWNIHTLAYALMMLVILSGIFGAVAYASLPAALSNNREQMTLGEMVGGIQAIDRQLLDAAQPLTQDYALLVLAATVQSPFDPGLVSRLSGRFPHCATQRAIEFLNLADITNPAVGRVETLLLRRKAQLDRLQRQMRLKALLEVWLYLHIPATIGLIAALIAHIVSVFYYW
ncbi:MAG: hypothetical protein ABIM50_00290 [Novosphingobium sp.]